MTEMKPKSYAAEKRMIQLTREQEERMAAQSAQKIQAFANELAQVQSRRCELAAALLTAHVTLRGLDGTPMIFVASARQLATEAIREDSAQKWGAIKAMFAELGVEGPQPHLEWAAMQVGVKLFDPPPEKPLIQPVGPVVVGQ